MAPTGQTVAAVLLALGLTRGPSAAQPPDTAETLDAPVVATETASAPPSAEPESATEPAESTPESAESAPEPVEPAPESAEPGPIAEETPPPSASEPPATAPQPEVDGDEAWEDESWEEDEETWEDDYDPLRDSPEALAAQRRIAGGAVVLGLGAMVSAGGLAMLLSDPCARPAGNSCSPAARNRAALTMALPGLATVAVGAVMLALGIRQRKALRLDASLTASGAGISFRGRF